MFDKLNDEALVLEPRDVYDKAIIGTDDGRAVYSIDKVIECGVTLFKTWEASSEWHDFNTFSAWHGEWTPVFK